MTLARRITNFLGLTTKYVPLVAEDNNFPVTGKRKWKHSETLITAFISQGRFGSKERVQFEREFALASRRSHQSVRRKVQRMGMPAVDMSSDERAAWQQMHLEYRPENLVRKSLDYNADWVEKFLDK